MQQLQKKKPKVNSKREKTLIEQRWIAKPQPKKILKRKKYWSLLRGQKRRKEKKWEGDIRLEENKTRKTLRKNRKINGN